MSIEWKEVEKKTEWSIDEINDYISNNEYYNPEDELFFMTAYLVYDGYGAECYKRDHSDIYESLEDAKNYLEYHDWSCDFRDNNCWAVIQDKRGKVVFSTSF